MNTTISDPTDILTATNTVTRTARQLGISLPDPIQDALNPDNHPRAQLDAHNADTPTVQAAIHAALTAGKNPATDKTVQKAITLRDVYAGAGNLDAIHAAHIVDAFTTHWDTFTNAVNTIFAPAAQALTTGHQALTEHHLTPHDVDAIRTAGPTVLTAWAAAVNAIDTINLTGRLMSHARVLGYAPHTIHSDRAHWTITPNLDTWIDHTPRLTDLWAVLDSGATLSLATTLDEATHRAQLVNRERSLATEALNASKTRGGFGAEQQTITYTGADGHTRTIDTHGSIRRHEPGNRVDLLTGNTL